MRPSRLGSDSGVQVSGVQAIDFLHNLLSDWNWRRISGCSQGTSPLTGSGKGGNLADKRLFVFGSGFARRSGDGQRRIQRGPWPHRAGQSSDQVKSGFQKMSAIPV